MLLAVLFFVAAVVMGAIIFFGMIDTHAMPLSCPRCAADAPDEGLGRDRCWYSVTGRGRVRCRTCRTAFREHPNGALVEDRDA